LTFFTDLHLRMTRPISRLDDDFLANLLAKVDVVREMANDSDAVILGGDIFDRPDVPHGVVVQAVRAFGKFDVPIYTVIGNHDVFGYQGATVESSAMGVLLESGVVRRLDSVNIKGVNLYGLHAYDKTLWSVPEDNKETASILVAHKLLTNISSPGLRAHLLSDVAAETNADAILSGDIHSPHHEELDGVLFANPGSMARLSIVDRNRQPQAAEITVDDSGVISCEFIPIATRPAESLFDLKGYSSRIASEERARTFSKTYAQAIISVKGEAHKIAALLAEFLDKNNVDGALAEVVKAYYDRAEGEQLGEMKD